MLPWPAYVKLADHVGRNDGCQSALYSLGHRQSLSVATEDGNSDVRDPIFAGILANRDRRLLAISGPKYHVYLTSGVPPTPDIKIRMSAFARFTSDMHPTPDVILAK